MQVSFRYQVGLVRIQPEAIEPGSSLVFGCRCKDPSEDTRVVGYQVIWAYPR